jgi:hypothetical protein
LPLITDDLVDEIEIIEGTLNGGGSTCNGAPRGVTYSSLSLGISDAILKLADIAEAQRRMLRTIF